MKQADRQPSEKPGADRRVILRVPLFTLVAGIGLAIGLIVPTVFEMAEEPAARSHHPGLERAALIAIVVSLLITAIVWFFNRRRELNQSGMLVTPRPVQFGIRHIFIAITLVALFLAVSPLIKSIIVPWMIINVAAGLLVWSFFLGPGVPSRFASLLAAMFLPFSWIVSFNKPFGHTSGLLSGIAYGPGLIPAILMRSGNIDESAWIGGVFVILEMAFGFWLARRPGSIPVLIYIALVLLVSSACSLFFHFAYRAS